MKFFRRKELTPLWGDESGMLQQYRRVWDSSPVLRRFYQYLWGSVMREAVGSPVIEVGGGAGFIRDFHPEVITTDLYYTPGTALTCDAAALPFQDASVGSFLAVACFHHWVNPRRTFQEISRALKPGGRFIIYDPYISPLSRCIFPFATDESLDMTEPPFESERRSSAHPLLEANVARATIIFERNRSLFEQAFPELRIVSVEPIVCFRHLVAGSCVQKSPIPAWCYPVTEWVDKALQPLRRQLGLCLQVVLEKTAP